MERGKPVKENPGNIPYTEVSPEDFDTLRRDAIRNLTQKEASDDDLAATAAKPGRKLVESIDLTSGVHVEIITDRRALALTEIFSKDGQVEKVNYHKRDRTANTHSYAAHRVGIARNPAA